MLGTLLMTQNVLLMILIILVILMKNKLKLMLSEKSIFHKCIFEGAIKRRPPVSVYHRRCENLPDNLCCHHKGCENKPEDQLAIDAATWNVRALHDETDFKLTKLLNEMERLYIDVLGVPGTHWTNEATEAFQKEQHIIIHSCRTN